MLEKLGSWSTNEIQAPVRNNEGELITIIEYEGELLNCSVLTWLDGRDLNMNDVNNLELVKELGSQIAELHTFFGSTNIQVWRFARVKAKLIMNG